MLYVRKGIHQTAKPHLTLSLADRDKEDDGWWFHLDLDLARVNYEGFSAFTTAQDRGRFMYEPRRLTLRPPKDEKAYSAKVHIWPKEVTTKTALTKNGHTRRLSISLACHNDRLDALDGERTAREEKLRREKEALEAKKRQADEERKREEARKAAKEKAERDHAKYVKQQMDSGQRRTTLVNAFKEEYKKTKEKPFGDIYKHEKRQLIDEGKTLDIPPRKGGTGGRIRYDKDLDKIILC